MCVSKNRGGPPKSSILIRFSIIFPIHFRGKKHFFWKHQNQVIVSDFLGASIARLQGRCFTSIYRGENLPQAAWGCFTPINGLLHGFAWDKFSRL